MMAIRRIRPLLLLLDLLLLLGDQRRTRHDRSQYRGFRLELGSSVVQPVRKALKARAVFRHRHLACATPRPHGQVPFGLCLRVQVERVRHLPAP
jgi:hypothetical protein